MTTMQAADLPRGAYPKAPETQYDKMRKNKGRPFDKFARQLGYRKYRKNNTKIPFKMHVEEGDIVQVVYGKDRGLVTQVCRAYPLWNRVICFGANLFTKFVRPMRQDEVGMKCKVEAPFHATNVMHYDLAEKKAGYLGIKFDMITAEDGTQIVRKVRYNKATGNIIVPRIPPEWSPVSERENPTMIPADA